MLPAPAVCCSGCGAMRCGPRSSAAPAGSGRRSDWRSHSGGAPCRPAAGCGQCGNGGHGRAGRDQTSGSGPQRAPACRSRGRRGAQLRPAAPARVRGPPERRRRRRGCAGQLGRASICRHTGERGRGGAAAAATDRGACTGRRRSPSGAPECGGAGRGARRTGGRRLPERRGPGAAAAPGRGRAAAGRRPARCGAAGGERARKPRRAARAAHVRAARRGACLRRGGRADGAGGRAGARGAVARRRGRRRAVAGQPHRALRQPGDGAGAAGAAALLPCLEELQKERGGWLPAVCLREETGA